MQISELQRRLSEAIQQGRNNEVEALLVEDHVNPDFRDNLGTTPLHKAVGKNNPALVKLLIEHGADVYRVDTNGHTALNLATALDVNPDIIFYLEKQKKTASIKAPRQHAEPQPPAEPEPLEKIFEAGKWVGKTKEMQKKWEEVPFHIRKDFDFAAALTEARLQTLKRNASRKTVLKKPAPPPPPA